RGRSGGGRGSGRGRGSAGSAPTARTARNGQGTAEEEETLDIPLGLPRRGKGKSQAAKIEQAALVGLISVGINTVYSTASIFLGPHWELDDEESAHLAKAIDRALRTLPDSSYEIIRQYVEKIIPWVGLGIGLVA